MWSLYFSECFTDCLTCTMVWGSDTKCQLIRIVVEEGKNNMEKKNVHRERRVILKRRDEKEK